MLALPHFSFFSYWNAYCHEECVCMWVKIRLCPLCACFHTVVCYSLMGENKILPVCACFHTSGCCSFGWKQDGPRMKAEWDRGLSKKKKKRRKYLGSGVRQEAQSKKKISGRRQVVRSAPRNVFRLWVRERMEEEATKISGDDNRTPRLLRSRGGGGGGVGKGKAATLVFRLSLRSHLASSALLSLTSPSFSKQPQPSAHAGRILATILVPKAEKTAEEAKWGCSNTPLEWKQLN